MTDISKDFSNLIDAAARLSADAGELVREILQAGVDAPLDADEAHKLLSRVIIVMKDRAAQRGDTLTGEQLSTDVEEFIKKVAEIQVELENPTSTAPTMILQNHNGITPRPVKPTPVFHERQVPVVEGFVQTRDINLWGKNERIDIHLNQFFQVHGRAPRSEELLAIMEGKMSLPGLTDDDQFEIYDLARSIANNGVRKPPIIDQEGNLLDGNRRITACYLILNSDDFDLDQKRRAEWVQVWQLTEHATEDDREAVIVSLNFEPDHKQDWPQYVKARKVYDQWQATLNLEGRANPSATRQKEIRREIARKFAIGVEAVARYVSMVELASEFEDYHVVESKKDKYQVKHKAEKYFQYFDELGKGRKSGVLASLNDNEGFKSLVYDLLYDDKFKNWDQIRQLAIVAQNDEALAYFHEADEQKNLKQAQHLVEAGIAVAKANKEIDRVVGANKRVEIFTTWLENAPVKLFRPGPPDALTQINLDRLYSALKLVEGYVTNHDSEASAEGR